MSQPTVPQYTSALYEQLLETPVKKQHQLIASFVQTIQQHDQADLADAIIQDFTQYLFRKQNVISVVMVSATKLNNLHLISHQISRELSQDVEIKNLIQDDIIGGLVLYYLDYKIDFSLSNFLKKNNQHQNADFICLDSHLKTIISVINNHQDLLFASPVAIKPVDKIEIINFTASNKPNISQLEKELSARLAQKVIIHFEQDSNIIAGAIIEYDHRQIDNTIINKLN